MKQIIILFVLSFTFLSSHVVSAQTETTYQLSTHILDISLGKPAPDVTVTLFKLNPTNEEFQQIASDKTDTNGRIANFLASSQNNEGTYKLIFETYPYFSKQNIPSIYPYIEVIFQIEGEGHYHIPITLSANGYSTYKGN